jgi:hypothetical protein
VTIVAGDQEPPPECVFPKRPSNRTRRCCAIPFAQAIQSPYFLHPACHIRPSNPCLSAPILDLRVGRHPSSLQGIRVMTGLRRHGVDDPAAFDQSILC